MMKRKELSFACIMQYKKPQALVGLRFLVLL